MDRKKECYRLTHPLSKISGYATAWVRHYRLFCEYTKYVRIICPQHTVLFNDNCIHRPIQVQIVHTFFALFRYACLIQRAILRCLLLCSLAVLDPTVGHIMDILSPFIYVLSFWLTLRRGVLSTSLCCPSRPCVVFLVCVHLHCSLYYLFLPRFHSML